MADLLEIDAEIVVLRNIEDELPVIVGDGLKIVVEDLYDGIFDGSSLFIYQSTLYNGLLPKGVLDSEAK